MPAAADDVDEDEAAAIAEAEATLSPRPLRKPAGVPSPAGASWWVTAQRTRDEFAAAARRRDQQLQYDAKWRGTGNMNFRPTS